ncbi:riboflavin synthase [Candidatus Acetothermia bacterium]|nr:MAG: riboflavin synthase [Candidatus Acetothermia bacterium]
MFTGIVQGLGVLRRRDRGGVEIGLPPSIRDRLTIGGSVAVNGVCLTASGMSDGSFHADISAETGSRTTLGRLRIGERVNLELPLSPGSPLDGHIVLGHVDTVGRIEGFYREQNGWILIVSYPPEYRRYVVEKGAIAIDGISLTPYGLAGNTLRCAVIPGTHEKTNLKDRKSGDPVNIEFDIMAKYVKGMVRVVYTD